MASYTPISIVVEGPRGGLKLLTFTDLRCPDRLLTNRSTLIPSGSEIKEIGVGKKYRNLYKSKYKI
jgi:hypothetical protein